MIQLSRGEAARISLLSKKIPASVSRSAIIESLCSFNLLHLDQIFLCSCIKTSTTNYAIMENIKTRFLHYASMLIIIKSTNNRRLWKLAELKFCQEKSIIPSYDAQLLFVILLRNEVPWWRAFRNIMSFRFSSTFAIYLWSAIFVSEKKEKSYCSTYNIILSQLLLLKSSPIFYQPPI